MKSKFNHSILLAMACLVLSWTAQADDSNNKLTRELTDTLLDDSRTDHTIWVRFQDKGVAPDQLDAAIARQASFLDRKTLQRRSKTMLGKDLAAEADLPLALDYLERVASTGARLRQQSRWLNAASFKATSKQISAIAQLPFVVEVDKVLGGRNHRSRPVPNPTAEAEAVMRAAQAEKNQGVYHYGASYPGLSQINVPAAHATGLSGQGVTIAMLDTGFELDHECFQELDVVDTWDFVNGTDFVGNQDHENPDQTLYGTGALSALAGYSPSNLIGPAFGASLILAKTENLDSETPVEEDNWIAALEWAELLGADIISSSLGYIDWYDFSDLDGQTTRITIAAEMAAARGVLVVNSAGDQRANPQWPHIVPPADGRNVLAVGSIDLFNHVTYQSGPGPTADGRIKPDVMALGSGTAIALSRVNNMYFFGHGTNYATPLVAGVAAMVLEQNPHLNPAQVREALRLTSSRSILPDNDYGWGTINALAAINYWAPVIEHSPLPDVEPGGGSFQVEARITSEFELDHDNLWVYWRRQGESWNMKAFSHVDGDDYIATIGGQVGGTTIDYYLMAQDTAGRTRHNPQGAPGLVHTFTVAEDETGPTLVHIPLTDQSPETWQPTVRVEASDALGVAQVSLQYCLQGQPWQGPYDLENNGTHWEITFPWEHGIPGVGFSYFIIARDQAEIPNSTAIGPFDFEILENRGRVLVVDDRGGSKSNQAGRGPMAGTPSEGEKNANQIEQWLAEAGYEVEVLAAEQVGSSSFLGYDAIMVSSGGNYSPLSHPELRRSMVSWSEAGGRILVEGGEVAYVVGDEYEGYPEVAEKVLYLQSYLGDDAAVLHPPLEYKDHYLVNRPHPLPVPFTINNSNGGDWSACDLVSVTEEATVVMQAGYGSSFGGVVYHDDNSCPEGGQMVFLPFNILKTIDQDGRALMDNAMTFLTQEEPAGRSSISGKVKRVGQSDHSGIIVQAGPRHSAVSNVDGSYIIEGLWAGEYNISADAPGFAPDTRQINLPEDTDYPGVNLYLAPVEEVSYPDSPGLAIPDNDPTGITRTVQVAEDGELMGIEIDGNISHYSVGQLVITLTSPAGTEVTLHNRTGGTADDLVGTWPISLFVDGPGELDDFLGEDPQGQWAFQVVDAQFGATGTLNSWSLNLLVKTGNIAPADDLVPGATRLLGNVPNPFNPQTNISFELDGPKDVVLEIFDVKGRLVRTLARREFTAGQHTVLWDGKNNQGSQPASGIYFSRLQAGGTTEVRKMMLVR